MPMTIDDAPNDRNADVTADDAPGAGRPPDYRDEFAVQAEKLCRLGATDFELADFFEVTTRTIYRWKHTHDKFCQAVKAGKEMADQRVERALYNRAVGYSFEGEKVFQYQGEVVRADTVEHVPPDPGAAFNWLKNRKPAEWREKVTQELTGPDGGPVQITRIERVIVDAVIVDATKGQYAGGSDIPGRVLDMIRRRVPEDQNKSPDVLLDEVLAVLDRALIAAYPAQE